MHYSSCAAREETDEEEIIKRTRYCLHASGANIIVDLSPLAVFNDAAEAERLRRRRPQLERRFQELLNAVRLCSVRVAYVQYSVLANES